MKLTRKALIHYINAKFAGNAGTAEWFKIGKNIEDMSVEMNPETDSKKNIWGENVTDDNGYTPSMDADPYYANPDDAIYEPLRDIAMERKTGDECKTQILEVIIEDTAAVKHMAWVEDVIVKPQSYGGSNYVNIPFNVSFDGNRKKGYVTAASITEGAPVFTEGSMTGN